MEVNPLPLVPERFSGMRESIERPGEIRATPVATGGYRNTAGGFSMYSLHKPRA